METPPLHDLVIRTIAEYCVGWNEILVVLQHLNSRFYSLRDIFIGQVCLTYLKSSYAYWSRPYGWNKVHSFVLNWNQDISDVSDLGSIRILTIHCCHNISDVSGLRKVDTLTLSSCYGISDVSALSNVRCLTISYCGNIRDISSLQGVKKLHIYDCPNITDISALRNVPELRTRRLLSATISVYIRGQKID